MRRVLLRTVPLMLLGLFSCWICHCGPLASILSSGRCAVLWASRIAADHCVRCLPILRWLDRPTWRCHVLSSRELASWRIAQRSIGIAAHAVIGRDRRCQRTAQRPEDRIEAKAAVADPAGKEPEEHQRNGPQQHPPHFEQAANNEPYRG